ncbi:MAG: hypothetical protein R3E10_12810 [Gemmatimonadota bacterium]
MTTAPRTQRSILLFWVPLAATWLMMALEGPFVAAVIARMADPAYNLAAYGVTFAVGFLVEAPVLMLLSTSTALASDGEIFRRLRAFAYALCALSTLGLLLVLMPPVYRTVIEGWVALPPEVSRLTYPSLWVLLPWPAAIGYRRFYQGILIRDDRTRLVALGTLVRLLGMAVASLVLFHADVWPGALVAATALVIGVVGESLATRWMASDSIARLGRQERDPAAGAPLDYRGIARFYYPLALTSLIGLAVQPMLTFFMGRAPAPLESLAVFPVVHSLGFVFRAACLAFQEVAIALLGSRAEHLPELRRTTWTLALATSGVLAAMAVTPLASVWFETVSGLPPALARFAYLPTVLLIPIPFATAFLSLFRGVLVIAHRTGPITRATAIETLTIALGFPLLTAGFGVVGVTAALCSFLLGRVAGVASLVPTVRRTLVSLGATT